jgi:hypothetical protein
MTVTLGIVNNIPLVLRNRHNIFGLLSPMPQIFAPMVELDIMFLPDIVITTLFCESTVC